MFFNLKGVFTVLSLVFLIDGSHGTAWGQKPKPDPPRKPRMSEEGSPENRLSAEDKERVREVLSEAWKRPEVIAARDQVHLATERYQRVLQEAVAQIDPSAEGLMNQLHQESKMEAMRHRVPPHRKESAREMRTLHVQEIVDRIATSEPVFREFGFQDRARFLKLAHDVQDDPDLLAEIENLREAHDPKDHQNARASVRRVLLRKMRDSDPWAAEKLDHAPREKPPGSKRKE